MRFVFPHLKIFLPVGAVIALAAYFSFQREPNPLSEAEKLVAEWDLPGAEQILDQLHKTTPHDLTTTRLLVDVLLKRGELVRASEMFDRLERADTIDISSTILQSSFALFYRGLLDSAENRAKRVIENARGSGQIGLVARAYNLLGLIQFNRARYDSARLFQQQSLEFARQSGDNNAEADALRQLGVLRWYAGELDSALVLYYLPALEVYKRIDDRIGEATTLSNIGLLHNDKGDRMTGLRYQLEAFRIRKQIGDQKGLADSYYFLTASGLAERNIGFEYAYRLKSLELSTKTGYAWGREVAVRALEQIGSSPGFHLEAENIQNDSLLALSGEGRLSLLWNQAGRYSDRKEWHLVKQTLQEVFRLQDSLNYVLGNQESFSQYARACYELGEYTEAEHMLHKARRHVRSRSLRFNIAMDIDLGRIYVRRGESAKAKKLLKPAVNILDSLYLHYLLKPGVLSVRDRVTGIVYQIRAAAYALLMETVLRQNTEEIFQLIERERGLPFWGKREGAYGSDEVNDATAVYVRLLEQCENKPEQFANKTLLDERIGEVRQAALAEEHALGRISKAAALPTIPRLAAVRKALGEKEALLAYFLTERNVYVLITRRERSTIVMLPVTPDKLTESVKVLGELIMRGHNNRADSLWRFPASFLYDALLRPLEKTGHIQPGDHLLISPHKILHLLTFPALCDSQTAGIHAIQKYTISIVPYASRLVETRSTKPAPMRSLLAAAPIEDALPFSQKEVQGIPIQAFEKTVVLDPDDATKEGILTSLSHYDIVHLATHAKINSRYPVYSYIESADGRLELHQLFNRAVPARLVVLSACETGVSHGLSGTDETSQDIVSFPMAFIQNGTPSVISSLWLVEDESTALFFHEFYSSLTTPGTTSLAGALAETQRKFLSDPKNRYNHPFYWAAFYLAGDER
ncbi:MAG TPA: CHAT domain-containing protein [Bacteroidota bacterium]|nr:CHAT domain-containing protein [Bacteroidota bacterium]